MSESDAGRDRERRLAFGVPPIECAPEDIDTNLLDPADPDERALLIRAAHPELDTEQETIVLGGHEINPRLISRSTRSSPPSSPTIIRRRSGRPRSVCVDLVTAATRSSTCSERP